MDASSQGRANRRRGADAERAVVRYLRSRGYPDARRYLAGDSMQPGDLDWHPLFCVEVKDVAASMWPTWCRQALDQCKPGLVPVVVRRERGVSDPGRWECRVRTISWQAFVGRWMPLTVCSSVDGESWQHLPFSMLVDMVWLLDHPEDCYLPDGAA